MSKQVRLNDEVNQKALKIAAKVNATLSGEGVSVSKQQVVNAAMNSFYDECAQLEGISLEEWIASMFKGDF